MFLLILSSCTITSIETIEDKKIAKEVFSISTNVAPLEEAILTKVYKKTVTNLKDSLSKYLQEPTENNLQRLKFAEKKFY